MLHMIGVAQDLHRSLDAHHFGQRPYSAVSVLQGVMPLLANQPLSQTQLRMHASVPGMPGPHWEDQLRGYPLTASAPARYGGHPGSPNTYYAQVIAREAFPGWACQCNVMYTLHLPRPGLPVLCFCTGCDQQDIFPID